LFSWDEKKYSKFEQCFYLFCIKKINLNQWCRIDIQKFLKSFPLELTFGHGHSSAEGFLQEEVIC